MTTVATWPSRSLLVRVYGSFGMLGTGEDASGLGVQPFQVQCGGQELDGLSGTGAGAD